MDVIVRSNYNPVNDMTAPVSGLINDLDKDINLCIVVYLYRNMAVNLYFSIIDVKLMFVEIASTSAWR